jgi:hypothetical protein
MYKSFSFFQLFLVISMSCLVPGCYHGAPSNPALIDLQNMPRIHLKEVESTPLDGDETKSNSAATETQPQTAESKPLDGEWIYSSLPTEDSDHPIRILADQTFKNDEFLSFQLNGLQGAILLLSPETATRKKCILTVPIQVSYSQQRCCKFVKFQIEENDLIESTPGCIREVTERDIHEVMTILKEALSTEGLVDIERKYLMGDDSHESFNLIPTVKTHMNPVSFKRKAL